MNLVVITGRVGKDPETFTFENGDKKTSFSMATTEKWHKDNEWHESTEWHNVVIFKESKLKKGDLISVTGKIKTRKYTDSNSVDKYVTEIISQRIEFLHRKE